MKPALLLIDFQNDYLTRPNLQPAAGKIVQLAARLLNACRKRSIPIIHVRTAVHRNPDDRMSHWKTAGRWMCEPDTPGYTPPKSLAPVSGETVVEKQFFSGFGKSELSSALRASGCDTLLMAGLQLHACVRATALDGYEQGFKIWIADDAVASDDVLHAAITRRYLSARDISFVTVEKLIAMLNIPATGLSSSHGDIEHRSPADTMQVLWKIKSCNSQEISRAATAAKEAWETWRQTGLKKRAAMLCRLADLLEAQEDDFAEQITQDIGKPITMAHAEVRRSAALIRGVADHAAEPLTTRSGEEACCRYLPLGVVAVITSWNNSLAIPAGKIAPALLYGNTVLFKPATPGSMVAQKFLQLIRSAFEIYPGPLPVELCMGDHHVASQIAEHGCIDAVSLSGSLSAGYALQEICARRHIPFQGELGGNNAAIVWDDADPQESMMPIAAGAFGFAGQRCTANRRLIVSERLHHVWLKQLQHATLQLGWGDPRNLLTTIGPLISAAKRDEVAMLLERATQKGSRIFIPHAKQDNSAELSGRGAYHPPAIVCCDEPDDEIVQEETFGPVLVVQSAKDFDHAIRLCNGVRQGLAAALFTSSDQKKQEFLSHAKAGVLKINRSTADADATSPLGGWKASGVGPAEHGSCDREFFCRVQTVYAPHDDTIDCERSVYSKAQEPARQIPL
jgi:alpha-ketoglutaric semialdehyde dehydrogenase